MILVVVVGGLVVVVCDFGSCGWWFVVVVGRGFYPYTGRAQVEPSEKQGGTVTFQFLSHFLLSRFSKQTSLF